MLFNVSKLLKEPTGTARSYEVDEALALTDDGGVNRVRGTVNLLRTPQGAWVSAALDSAVQCTCSRCLTECRQPVHMAIDEEFLTLADAETGATVDRSAEGDEYFCIDKSHILDLREAARQYAAICMPMKPVCRDDCAGICMDCGVNLNETTCKCDKTPRDPKWGPLLELVEK